MEKYKNILKKLKTTGFFSIFLSSVFSKVIVFLGGTLIVRLLSQDNYAKYTLILNAFSLLCILSDLGASPAALQFMTENRNDEKKVQGFFKYGLKVAFFSGLTSAVLILFSRIFYPYKSVEIANYTTFLFLVPIITSFSGLFGSILRSKRENKRYSILQICTTLIHYAVILPFTYFWHLLGALLAQYVYGILILVLGLIIAWKFIRPRGATSGISKQEKTSFLKLAFASQINNSISNLHYAVDIFLLGLLISNTNQLAIYKVATIIPTALAFLPYCFIIYIFPYFIINNNSKDWLLKNLKLIIKYGAVLYGLLSILLLFASYFIILILYGNNYLAAVLPFNILIIGFYFEATISMPCVNMIYSQKKVKINILINIIAIVINFILDIIFIKLMGYIGVAIVTTIVKIITAIISYIYATRVIKKLN